VQRIGSIIGLTVLLLGSALAVLGYGELPESDRDGLASATGEEVGAIRGERRKQSDAFSDIELIDQFGNHVRFYDDLIRDRAVIVNFFYTTCAKTCPGTSARLASMHDELEPWIGNELTLVSISIDPTIDTPDRLKDYWDVFGSKPGWLMLTGDEDEITRLRRQLGVYDLDPVVDADKTQHAGIITFGNDNTDRWAALPVFMHQERMLETILHTTRDVSWRAAGHRGGEPHDRESDEALFRGRGIVRGIHPDRAEVLVEHEAIPGLMTAMTMVFGLTDPGLLEGLAIGNTIEFELKSLDGRHQIQAIRADDEVRVSSAGPAGQSRSDKRSR
jgi:protein SCO1/2